MPWLGLRAGGVDVWLLLQAHIVIRQTSLVPKNIHSSVRIHSLTQISVSDSPPCPVVEMLGLQKEDDKKNRTLNSRWSLTLSSRWERNSMILAHHNLSLLGSRDSSTPAPQVARITGTHHHAWMTFFVVLVEMGFHHVRQAGFKLLTSGNPPAPASQNAGITGMSHRAWPPKFELPVGRLQNHIFIPLEQGLPTPSHGPELGRTAGDRVSLSQPGQSAVARSWFTATSTSRVQRSGFLHVAKAGLELLTSGDLPTSTSQSARNTGMSHHAQQASLHFL
ncbi:hypothetical protein AAY473_006477 [Plecturocebus cupreus]